MVTELVTTEDRELKATDRCDACSAGAKVIAKFLHGELMFCGHHAKKNKTVLQEKAIEVYDPESVMLPLE